MQALYLLALEPVSEGTSDPNSYGFRINRSTADAMSQLFVSLSQKASAQWVLEADIKGCFDHISHDWLERIARDKPGLFAHWPLLWGQTRMGRAG
jgi:RNA-directed DNA polymerase